MPSWRPSKRSGREIGLRRSDAQESIWPSFYLRRLAWRVLLLIEIAVGGNVLDLGGGMHMVCFANQILVEL